MKLFLASEAKNPATVEKLTQYVGGFKGKSIAYIPTAANGEQGWGEWKEGGSWKSVQTLGADLTLVQLEDYHSSNVIDVLQNKDIIWFAGGFCGYLMYWIRRTKLDIHLKELLKKSLYVGSSAGSMITAPTLDIAEWYAGAGETGASAIPGLGLVNFDFYPHYDESILDYIKQNYKGKKMYLLKNGEEIIVEDDNIRVNGEKRILTS